MVTVCDQRWYYHDRTQSLRPTEAMTAVLPRYYHDRTQSLRPTEAMTAVLPRYYHDRTQSLRPTEAMTAGYCKTLYICTPFILLIIGNLAKFATLDFANLLMANFVYGTTAEIFPIHIYIFIFAPL